MSVNEKMTAIADAIRAKTGKTDALTLDQMATEIEGITTGGTEDLNGVLTEQESLIAELQAVLAEKAGVGGGGGASASKKDVNFYDYDGTLLYSYTVAEAQALSELPALPKQEGLICQGWNWSLEDIKAHNRAVDVGAMYITDDGTTRIHITLQEGRTSPVIGVCPKGTVTVDWGDGTAPDVLTGTSTTTVKYTPRHEYEKPGDYVIRLTVDGEIGLYGSSSWYSCILSSGKTTTGESLDYSYRSAVKMIQLGSGVTTIGSYAFYKSLGIARITIPNSVTSIGKYAFENCYSLEYITIPSVVTALELDVFRECRSLCCVSIPNSVTSIANYCFTACYSLKSLSIPNSVISIGTYLASGCCSLVQVTLPNNLKSIGDYAFNNCYSLRSVNIPNSVTSIGKYAFAYCYTLPSIDIPNGVTSIGNYAFRDNYSLAFIFVPNGVTTINNYTFNTCYSMRVYDFSSHTSVPTLSNTNAFSSMPADCEIRIAAALYDAWIAATNWSSLASNIVAA